MNREEILNKVIKMFSAMTEAEEITENSELVEDLEISSMDILYVISCLEEEFHIKIGEKDIRKMYTVGDVVDIIVSLKK